jgi:quinol-cytochrome oxidoreductase complex cytochrome b subunit
MVRPILQEFALFLTPFAVYAIYLWATRAKVLDPQSWPLSRLMWLTIVALLMVAISFIVLAQWGGEPAGSQYVPAHIENGRLVPGKSAK